MWSQHLNKHLFLVLILLTLTSLTFFHSARSLAASDTKKIEVGDVIEIIIYGEEELTRVVKVSQQGTINFPFLQNIPIDGLTLDELRDIIVVQLSKYYVDKKPIVILTYLNTYLINVTILGQVRKPGTYQIPQNSTIQGAIGEAGGFIPGAKLKELKLIRRKDSTSQTIEVDLEKFILEADIFLLPELEDEDLIFVPGWPGANSVKITGEVKDPGNYEIFADLQNVLDIIFKAGGTTDEADLAQVLLISPQKYGSNEQKINIEKKIATRQYNEIPVVKPGDVIYIPKKRNYWKMFVQVMRDITGFATLYIIFKYGRRF